MKKRCSLCKRELTIEQFTNDNQDYKSQNQKRYCRACVKKMDLDPLLVRKKRNRALLKEVRKNL